MKFLKEEFQRLNYSKISSISTNKNHAETRNVIIGPSIHKIPQREQFQRLNYSMISCQFIFHVIILQIIFLKLFQRHTVARNVIIGPSIRKIPQRGQFQRLNYSKIPSISTNNFPKNHAEARNIIIDS